MGFVDGVNLYAYVNNNPVNLIDPYGYLGERIIGFLFDEDTYQDSLKLWQLGNEDWRLRGVAIIGIGATIGDASFNFLSGGLKGEIKKELTQYGKRRLAKELGGIPRSATPIAQRINKKLGSWWEYISDSGRKKIVIEHPDGTVHVGAPKPQSTHYDGGPPKYYQEPGTGHIGEE